MRTLLFLMLLILQGGIATGLAADPARKPPVNNSVSPCDDSVASRKPPCHIDSDSVNVPPEMPKCRQKDCLIAKNPAKRHPKDPGTR